MQNYHRCESCTKSHHHIGHIVMIVNLLYPAHWQCEKNGKKNHRTTAHTLWIPLEWINIAPGITRIAKELCLLVLQPMEYEKLRIQNRLDNMSSCLKPWKSELIHHFSFGL